MELEIFTGYGDIKVDATPELLRSALYPEGEIDYGTTFTLGPAAGVSLVAICISEMYLRRGEQGEFLLGLAVGDNYRECTERFTRAQVLERLNKFMVGDHAWIDNLQWKEV
jgi:hypothetical protein